jgi:carbamoyltransferase
MNILGISAGFHDAAVSIINHHGDILFAGHSERYSKIKHDSNLCDSIIEDCLDYSPFDTIAYYEKPLLKQSRHLYSGQKIEWDKLTIRQILNTQFNDSIVLPKKTKTYSHHLSHAAAGFQTSNFDRATVVVIDAIGEWETVSIWAAEYVNDCAVYKKLWSKRYPHSIGLFYSAMTQQVGLKPLDEEYILMGMSAYGNRNTDRVNIFKNLFIENEWELDFKQNFHIGHQTDKLNDWHNWDIAAAAQCLTENLVCNVMRRARNFNWSENLVYMGGVALNCVFNSKLFNYFNDVWIMPNPGDAGSSLGAAALVYGKKLNWQNAFLGHNIAGPYPTNSLLDELLTNKIVGVANGRAEFGPRALGNRSLLADPRGSNIKNKVNNIKQRQQFRPFAPVILEELASDYFEMPTGKSRYMQYVAKCKFPDLYPAIVHIDDTSRVQTVSNDGSGLRELLEKWYVVTGCPMLLNTSLNIRGEPMVNDISDASRFEKLYGVKVLTCQ